MLPERERSSFVEHHRGHQACFFEASSIAHEQSVPRAEGGGERDHERNGKTQGMWARDNEDGNYSFFGVFAWSAGERESRSAPST